MKCTQRSTRKVEHLIDKVVISRMYRVLYYQKVKKMQVLRKKQVICAYLYSNTKKQLIFAKSGEQAIRGWGGVVTLITALYSFTHGNLVMFCIIKEKHEISEEEGGKITKTGSKQKQ